MTKAKFVLILRIWSSFCGECSKWLRLNSYSFYLFDHEFCGRSHWYSLELTQFMTKLMTKSIWLCILYESDCIAFLSVASITKWKWIDQNCINVIDYRIVDWLHKVSMNRALLDTLYIFRYQTTQDQEELTIRCSCRPEEGICTVSGRCTAWLWHK